MIISSLSFSRAVNAIIISRCLSNSCLYLQYHVHSITQLWHTQHTHALLLPTPKVVLLPCTSPKCGRVLQIACIFPCMCAHTRTQYMYSVLCSILNIVPVYLTFVFRQQLPLSLQVFHLLHILSVDFLVLCSQSSPECMRSLHSCVQKPHMLFCLNSMCRHEGAGNVGMMIFSCVVGANLGGRCHPSAAGYSWSEDAARASSFQLSRAWIPAIFLQVQSKLQTCPPAQWFHVTMTQNSVQILSNITLKRVGCVRCRYLRHVRGTLERFPEIRGLNVVRRNESKQVFFSIDLQVLPQPFVVVPPAAAVYAYQRFPAIC